VAASRALLAGVRYDDQKHLPQALLDIELSLATEAPAAAVAVADEALRRYDLSASNPRYVWPLLVTAAAVAAAARQPAGDAAALLCTLRTLAEKLEVHGPVQRAWQLSYAVVDPQADANAPDRLAAADEAASAWEAIKQPYPAAIALVRGAAIALSGAGGREAAAARLRRAAPIAERLGARPLAEQIADLSRRVGDSPAGDAAPSGNRLGLTGREFEVLRLVAAGQSNRAIATALFISPKTASVHVSNILGKLGVSTRTEAAAKAHALRLFAT
jgi:DNA-binding CsgD family transcriptional regulator